MKSSIDDTSTAGLIRKFRKMNGMSQKDLAQHAGVSYSFVNQVEGGKESIRLDAANKILKVFGYEMAPQLIETAKIFDQDERKVEADLPASEEAKKPDWAFFT